MYTINFNTQRLIAEVERNVSIALNEVGKGLVEYIRNSMAPGGGKVYKYKTRSHQASAPSQPPSPESGRLKDSITWATSFGTRSNPGGSAQPGDGVGKPETVVGFQSVVVGSNVPYALSMELGQKGKTGRFRTRARPYLWPALKKNRELIKKAFTRV